MSDAPSFTFSAREKRGDKPCLDSETLMKIAVAQLMFDAISKVVDMTKMQYVIDLERQLAEANWKLAMIQQAVSDFAGDKTP